MAFLSPSLTGGEKMGISQFIDSAISVISPRLGAQRTAYRQVIEELRGSYDVGDFSRINANWIASGGSGEFLDRGSRDIVRNRARDLERNSDMMNSLISAWVRNIIGGGRKLQVQIEDEELGDQIEKLWSKWCKARNCDVTGTQNFNQILRTAVKRKKIDGGVLFLKRYTNYGLLPFQLQMLEVDELDLNQYQPKTKGNKVVGGIELTPDNRPVGYYIRKYSLDGMEILSDSQYVDAKDVIFYFSKSRFSQCREMPEMTPVMKRIRDANEFMNAVSVKERINACLAVFIKRQLPTVGLGRGPSVENKYSYNGKMLTPGMINELNAGDEVQVVNPTGQAADASTFIKTHQRMIAAGNGLSYEATSRDMSQSNYSSARQGIIEDGETFADDREAIESVMDEIYETFVISAVLSGAITIPDFWNNKEQYFDHAWVKAPKPWIDPAKEATANKTALETGQKTFKDIAAETGKDWRQAIKDMADVNEYADKLGVTIGGGVKNSEIQQNDKKDDDTSA